MDILKFEQFIKVCETKNLTKAAEELFITQPALSQSIASFEDFWGHKLFDRNNKKLILNEKGRLALEYSYHIMNNINSLRQTLDNVDQNKNSLTTYSIDTNLLFYIISGFLIENPRIILHQLEKCDDSLEKLLLSKRADIVISTEKMQNSRINSFLLITNKQYVLTPKNSIMYNVPCAKLKDFVDCEFIRGLEHEDLIMSATIDKYLIEKRPPLGLVHYIDPQISRRIKSKSNYHSFVTQFSFYNTNFSYDRTNHSIVLLTDPEFSVSYYVSYLKDCSPAAKQFLHWLSEHYKYIFQRRKRDF